MDVMARRTGQNAGWIAPLGARMGLCLLLASAVVGCGNDEFNVSFDGHKFRGGAKAVDRGAREDFIVTIRQVSKSEKGARLAAAHEATKYCIRWFGISTVEWETPPDAEVVPIDNDVLTLRGSCIE